MRAHVFNVGLPMANDPVIWEHARKASATLISKDEDRYCGLPDPLPVTALDPKGELFEPRFDGVVTTSGGHAERLEQGERLVELRG